MKWIRNFVNFENEHFFSKFGALASPDRAKTPLERCAMENNVDFKKSRKDPRPGGLFPGVFLYFAHARSVLDRVDMDEVD